VPQVRSIVRNSHDSRITGSWASRLPLSGDHLSRSALALPIERKPRVAQGFSPANFGRGAGPTSLRQGYGGPPKLYAKAEGLRHIPNTSVRSMRVRIVREDDLAMPEEICVDGMSARAQKRHGGRIGDHKQRGHPVDDEA
jgi:hypothetical protein